MITKRWNELGSDCPIDISSIVNHAKEFDANIPNKIDPNNLNKYKESVLMARSNFDSMVTSLIQNLHDKEILKNSEDRILFSWLVDNLGRYLKKLDDNEDHLIVRFDEPNKDESRVGVSRISAYTKILVTSADTMIYESLFKATKEYKSFKETKEVKREPRLFLYILFQILQVTMSVIGGLTREKNSSKKGIVNSIPTNWQGLMTKQGQEIIKDGYQEDTGIKVDELQDSIDKLNFSELEDDFDN